MLLLLEEFMFWSMLRLPHPYALPPVCACAHVRLKKERERGGRGKREGLIMKGHGVKEEKQVSEPYRNSHNSSEYYHVTTSNLEQQIFLEPSNRTQCVQLHFCFVSSDTIYAT